MLIRSTKSLNEIWNNTFRKKLKKYLGVLEDFPEKISKKFDNKANKNNNSHD